MNQAQPHRDRSAPTVSPLWRWRPLLILAATHPMWLGCAEEAGGPTLYLSDASQGCASRETGGLDRPIALGARLDLRVQLDETDVSVTGVDFSDGTVLAVEALGNPAGLRSISEGSTEVTVRDSQGNTGRAQLEVNPIASAQVAVDAVTVYNFDRYLEVPFECGTKPLTEKGFALLPDGWIGLDLTLRDADGNQLLGYDVADWKAAPASLAFEPSDERTDDVRLSPLPSAQSGPVVVKSVGSGHFEVELLPTDAPLTGQVYVPEHGMTRDALSLGAGEIVTVVLVVSDGAGRFVRGEAGVPFAAKVTGATGVVALRDPPWAKPEGDIELDDEARTLLRLARVATVEAKAVGQTELLLGAAGVSVKLPITVK